MAAAPQNFLMSHRLMGVPERSGESAWADVEILPGLLHLLNQQDVPLMMFMVDHGADARPIPDAVKALSEKRAVSGVTAWGMTAMREPWCGI